MHLSYSLVIVIPLDQHRLMSPELCHNCNTTSPLTIFPASPDKRLSDRSDRIATEVAIT